MLDSRSFIRISPCDLHIGPRYSESTVDCSPGSLGRDTLAISEIGALFS